MRLKRFKSLIFGGFLLFFFFYFTVNFMSLSSHKILFSEEQIPSTDQPAVVFKPEQRSELKKGPVTKEYSRGAGLNGTVQREGVGDANGKSRKYYVYDGSGLGSFNLGTIYYYKPGVTNCLIDNTLSLQHVNSLNKTDIFYFNMHMPPQVRSRLTSRSSQYFMVYALESEVHSFGGQSWAQADFRMYYSLDKSFPEPATYFDTRAHLVDLLAPSAVPFAKKNSQVPIVWVVSNCNAYNGREAFMRELMAKIGVDSYGGCLRNKHTHPSEHMRGNIQLFSAYKFTIAIENSNCEDYVTEKLVHAVASGSIPIVAGRDNKPNYLRFLPSGSFINVYDYGSVDELVAALNRVAASPVEYGKFMAFKFGHEMTREELRGLSMAELVGLAKRVMGANETFFGELIAKERSENKLCKVARWLEKTAAADVHRLIERNRARRPESSDVCLGARSLRQDFHLV